MKNTNKKKLRLRRQSIRVLSGSQIGQPVGGTEGMSGVPGCLINPPPPPPSPPPQPYPPAFTALCSSPEQCCWP